MNCSASSSSSKCVSALPWPMPGCVAGEGRGVGRGNRASGSNWRRTPRADCERVEASASPATSSSEAPLFASIIWRVWEIAWALAAASAANTCERGAPRRATKGAAGSSRSVKERCAGVAARPLTLEIVRRRLRYRAMTAGLVERAIANECRRVTCFYSVGKQKRLNSAQRSSTFWTGACCVCCCPGLKSNQAAPPSYKNNHSGGREAPYKGRLAVRGKPTGRHLRTRGRRATPSLSSPTHGRLRGHLGLC